MDTIDCLALHTDLHDAGHKLPTQMLALMTLLEKEGPAFSDRLLVTIRGGWVQAEGGKGGGVACHGGLRCVGLKHAFPQLLSVACTNTPSPCRAGVEDRGLVYQAEGETTSVADAIRNVFLRPVDGETKVGTLRWEAKACMLWMGRRGVHAVDGEERCARCGWGDDVEAHSTGTQHPMQHRCTAPAPLLLLAVNRAAPSPPTAGGAPLGGV